MQLGQKLIPLSLNITTSPLYLQDTEAFFLRGVESEIKGENNQGEIRPLQSNFLYATVNLPKEGYNIVIGAYKYEEEKSVYVVVFNSEGYHFIYRLKEGGVAEIVYRFCRNFEGITENEEDYFSVGRITIKGICKFKPDGTSYNYKELYLVNKKVKNIRIVVEDSIATNSFTNPFFFSTESCCSEPCRIIQIGVPTPNELIKITPFSSSSSSTATNRLKHLFKFRLRYENAWGQLSEHGSISDAYFANLSACSDNAEGSPDCVYLTFKLPCPEITKVRIEVLNCTLKTKALDENADLVSDWKLANELELYNQSNPNLNWYEREYDYHNPEFDFVNNNTELRVKFCNNKKCETIAKEDIRDQNPVPLRSGSVATLESGLAFFANENGLPTIPKIDLKGFEIERIQVTNPCEVKYNRLKVYAVIVAAVDNKPTAIYNYNGRWGFGGLWGYGYNSMAFDNEATTTSIKSGSGQYFPSGVKGFRAGLAGTNYYATSKQYLFKGDVGALELKEFAENQEIGEILEFRRTMAGNNFLIQEFDFGLVQQGNYIFRIYGHNDTEKLENTSTYYLSNANFSVFKTNFQIQTNDRFKEIKISHFEDYSSIIPSSGNNYTPKVAIIMDLAAGRISPNLDNSGNPVVADSVNNRWTGMKGYFKEGINNIPIEGAKVVDKGQFDVINGYSHFEVYSEYTDHNGFFFGATPTKAKMVLSGFSNCVETELTYPLQRDLSGMQIWDEKGIYATRKVPLYATQKCNRWIIKGRVEDCNNNSGVSNISFVLEGVRPAYSDAQGNYTIIAHHGGKQNNVLDLRDIMISPNGLCKINQCDCLGVNWINNILKPNCTAVNNCAEILSTIPTAKLKLNKSYGFEHGSRVNVGITGYDFVRRTYIQRLEDWVIDFPPESEQQSSAYSAIKVKLPQTFSSDICKNYNRLFLSYTADLNNENFISWAADKVEFVDNADKESPAPTRIKVWYRSLNEYNKRNNFNNNTNWVFQSGDTGVYVSDLVQFIQNEDGQYIQPHVPVQVLYDKEGTYFYVPYTQELKDIASGVKFKIIRPKNCETLPAYYEWHEPIYLCGEDCKPRNEKGEVISEIIIRGINSYMIPRIIPAIIDEVLQVQGTDGAIQQQITQVKVIKNYPFDFEHNSPSDNWGSRCSNIGRVNYVNKYEGKVCDNSQILLTGAINAATDGIVNFLHYFSMDDEFVVSEQIWEGIQAAIVRDDNQILLICKQACFSLAYNDNRAVVTNQGYISVPTNKRFSRPERNPSYSFGCASNDLNTIDTLGSIVLFLDRQRQTVVFHNFSTGMAVSANIDSFLVGALENDEGFFWHGRIDIKISKYILTRFNKLKPDYIINSSVTDIKSHESLVFDFSKKEVEWSRLLNYTPEYFGSVGNQLFSFKNGLPFAHYQDNPTSFLNYYGFQCAPFIGVAANRSNVTVKGFTAMEVYCKETIFEAINIETETGQNSHTLRGKWEKGEGFSYAPILGDTKRTKANEGESLLGRWAKIIFAPYKYAGTFFKLTGVIVFMFPRGKSGESN